MANGTKKYMTSLTLKEVSVDRLGLMVLGGVSFALSPGDALILRGENGAGKTSLLRAIAGFAVHAGEICFAGEGDIDLDEARAQHLHFLGHRPGLSCELTVSEQLSFWGRFFGEPADPSLLQRLGLQNEAQKIRQLSAGQQRRLGLARLLVAPKAIWLMDEPLAALDQPGLDLLSTLWAEHRAKGGIVVMTSHGGPVPDQAQTLLLEVPA